MPETISSFFQLFLFMVEHVRPQLISYESICGLGVYLPNLRWSRDGTTPNM